MLLKTRKKNLQVNQISFIGTDVEKQAENRAMYIPRTLAFGKVLKYSQFSNVSG